MSVIRLPYVSDKPQSYWGDRENDGGLSGEQAWEFFTSYIQNAHPGDALLYSKTRKEALQQFGFGRYSLLTELWALQAERTLTGGMCLVHPRAQERGALPGARILCLCGGLSSSQNGWMLSLEYPQAEIVGVKIRLDDSATPSPSGPMEGPPNYRRVECSAAEAGNLPFENEYFDVIVGRRCWWTYAYLGKHNEVLNECFRVLKPGGVLEITTQSKALLKCDGVDVVKIRETLESWGVLESDTHVASKVREAGLIGLEVSRIGLPCGFDGEIAYLSEYLILFYRAMLLYQCSQVIAGGLSEETYRLWMEPTMPDYIGPDGKRLLPRLVFITGFKEDPDSAQSS